MKQIKRSKNMPLSMLVMLAWRNLWRQRKRTLITLSSIAFGFALAVFFIGLGDGSHNSMIRNAIKMGEGHIAVQANGYLQAPANHRYIAQGERLLHSLQQEKIAADLHPRVSLQVLASSASNSVGLMLEGVASPQDPRFQDIASKLEQGESDIFSEERAVLIGGKLASKLKLEVGSKLVLMAGKQGGDSQAQLVRVKGIFQSGLDELDAYLVFSSLAFSQLFLEGEGASLADYPLTRIAVFLHDPDEQTRILNSLQTTYSNDQVEVLPWETLMPQLVQFIVVDDVGNYIFLLLILVMVAVGVVNTVLMSVLERTREFGLLRALGISRIDLMKLVVLETLMLSVIAVLAGWMVAAPMHLWFAHFGIDFSLIMEGNMEVAGTYIDTMVYSELSTQRVLQLTLIILGVTLLTGIYPAIKAARVSPIAALKT